MTPSLFGDLGWESVSIEDQRARAVADRHYSRQQVATRGFVPPGERILLWHEDEGGPAIWAVCRNRDPAGSFQWRNTIFRNESGTLSSQLIRSATELTLQIWRRRYGALPAEQLTTEIDIEATRARRGRRHRPGRCYECAGWDFVRIAPRSHGRASKAIWRART